MKRFLSLALCVLMLMTMFTATAVQVMAAGNATELLTVTNGKFEDDTITYTVSLAPGSTKVTGAIIEAHFDGAALKVKNAGAAGSVDANGDFVQNVSGMYESGLKYNEDGVYAVAFMNATGFTVGDNAKEFVTITFEAVSNTRDMETVTFKCIEFVTDDNNTENDIRKANGAQDIFTHTFHSLSMPEVTEVNSIDGGLRVVWSEAVGAASYNLYRKEAGASQWSLLASDFGAVTEYIDTTVAMGTEYYYTVSAANEYGSTDYDVTGLAGLNFGTIDYIGAVATETGAKITWSALVGAEKYEVYRKLAVSSNWQLINTVTACEYADNSIISCTEYNYKVKAVKGKYSADMSCAPATVKFIAVPVAMISNVTDGIEIYFETVGAEKYIIEKKESNGAYAILTEIIATEDEDYSYVDENVVIDVKYSYNIQAVAGELSSVKKDIGSITRLGTPGVTEIKNTADGISLKWGAVNGATEYVISRKSENETVLSGIATTTATNYVDKAVVSGVEYTYCIFAQNDSGNGALSQPPVSLTFVSSPVVSSVSAVESGIEVKWGAVSGADSYKVYRTLAGNINWECIGTSETTNFVDTTSQYGVYYKYTVSATADNCESVYDTNGVEGMYFGNVKWIKAEPVENGAKISWEALSEADSYEVYRKTADDAEWTKLVKVTTTQYTDTKMASGVVYSYKVKAFNGKNASDMICAPASAKIIATPTGIAKNVNNGIQITVTPVNGAEGYVIEKKVDGVFVKIATLGANETAFVDSDVVAENEYTYRVYAVSSDINSGIYEIASVLRLSCPKITKITNTIPGISITWTALDGAGAYQVLRKEEGDKNWTVIAKDVTGTTYVDADVFSDEVYTYTINALMTDGGVSGYSEGGTSYKFLETPDLESVTKVSGGVQFKWSEVDGATAYIVYRKTSGTSWKNLGTVEGTSFTDKTVTNGKWTYTVKATDGKYQSYFDSGISIDYVGVSKPATPKLSKIQNAGSGVKVTWGSVKGAEKYIVYRKTYDAKTKKWSGWKNIASNVTTNYYVDKSAKSGTYYLYTVRANNAAGASGYNTSGIKTYFLSMPKVTTANANAGVTVKWSKAAGATGYIVYRKTGNGKWTTLGKVKGTSFTDKKAKAGVTYKYTVKAYYGSYVSAYNTSGVAIRRLTTPSLKSATSAKSGITFKWGKVTGATGYIVYRKTGNGSWVKLATVKGNSKISYLDKTAKKGVTYKYTVRAYYGSSTSAYNTKGIACKDRY